LATWKPGFQKEKFHIDGFLWNAAFGMLPKFRQSDAPVQHFAFA
jgi:hypothetical protein